MFLYDRMILTTPSVLGVSMKEQKSSDQQIYQSMFDRFSNEKKVTAQYQALIESIDNMVWSVEIDDYRLMTFNSYMEKYYKEVLKIELRPGLKPKDMLPTEELASFWIQLYDRASQGESFQVNYTMATSDRTLNISFNPMYIDKELMGISIFSKDITDIIKVNQVLKKENQKYKALIDHTSDYVYVVDAITYESILHNPASRAFILRTYGVDIDLDNNENTFLPEEGNQFWSEKYELVKESMTLSFRQKAFKGNAIMDFTMHYLEFEDRKQIMVIGKDVTIDVAYQTQLIKANEKLKNQLMDTIEAISKVCELRDLYTAGHQRRVQSLAVRIAQKMNLSEERVGLIEIGAIIHDVGKVYVPSEILSKPTKLSAIEFELIKKHPEFGYEIIRNIDLPSCIGRMVLEHHERLDGSGYPFGLKRGEIALESMVIAVADVVEAISTHRPYRPALGIDVALKEIMDQRGTLYCERVVDACLAVFDEGFEFESVFQ